MNTKQLREKFLSLAIQGKLVPQDASDEPAIELLKRINPKIKPIMEDVPFEVPESWVWCKMNDVISLLSGRDLEKDRYYSNKKGIPYIIGATNFENGHLLVNRWTDKPATISQMGDLLITCKGTIGEMAFNNIGDIHIARQVMAISSHYIDLKYIQALLRCNIVSLEAQAKSMIPGISRDTILNTSIPLPPLAEQQRIVERLEYIFSFIDTIEQAQDKMRETIKATRQKLLSLAVQGKLVPQDANDEPAINLLKRIDPKIEPIKEGVPFEVPESWVWCRIKDVGNIVTGSTPPKANKEYYDGNIPFFKPTDLEQGRNVCTSKDHLSLLGFEKSRQLPPNSILVTCIGATIGKTGMTSIEGTCNQQINAIISHKEIFPPYVYYACNSDFFQYKIKNNASATTLPILNKNKFADLIFPLPPLAEQKRIKERLENLFSTLDTIESNLN